GILNTKSAPKDKQFVNLNPETAFGPEVVTSFDFPNVDILDLTKHMQKLTGINLIYEKEIKGKISIVAPTPITVGDAWKAYLTALNIHGFSLVKSGAFYKIVQTRNIRNTPPKIYMGSYTPNTENYVMRIMALKNVGSAEIARNFRQFMSQFGRIIEIRQTNTVILQDTGANINRLVRLIKFLDVTGYEESLQIIKVQNSSAQEIAGLLDKILRGQGTQRFQGGDLATGGRPQAYDVSKLIAEARTNSIIAMTTAEGARQLRELIKKLDVKLVSKGSGQIHVYYLNYGDSETLAKTLSSLVSSAGAPAAAGRFGASRVGEASLFASAVKITSDKANNALVVMASPTDYLTIKNIIAKLDIPRDQVYVEGLVMEAQVSSGSEFGISLVGVYGAGNARRWGSNPNGTQDLLSLLTNNITNLSGMFVGLGAGKRIQHSIGNTTVDIHTVNGLIKAIASDSSTNVLATPQILALDNEEAVFEAGETVPTSVRETAANGSTSTSTSQQKVALTLKFTPQINKVTHMIKLKINQKIDDFSGRQTGAVDGVGTTTRQAVTTVIVRDKDTVAMGGLMRDKNIEKESKVPLLGDIPVLGWLFKSKSKSSEKVNLLFFLTPRILAPYERGAAETTKDMLNRRNAHLQKVYEEGEDPFRATIKGLYKKIEKQEEGPLYDQSTSAKFINENTGGGHDLNDEDEDSVPAAEDEDANGAGVNSAANANVNASEEEYEANYSKYTGKHRANVPPPNYQKIMEEVKKETGKSSKMDTINSSGITESGAASSPSPTPVPTSVPE
ncbi:MAG: type II secretion system secretin GspD, partial [Oligoflexia bacterium]|nr:type II secretion system secretin GspD [Oligoflexia bacterium]